MARDFSSSAGRVETTLSVFFVGVAVGQAIYGPVTDRFGRRRPLLDGIALFTLTTLLCPLTSSIGVTPWYSATCVNCGID